MRRAPRFVIHGLLACLVCSVSLACRPPPVADPFAGLPAHERLVYTLAAELGTLGHPIDPAGLTIKTVSESQLRQRVGDHLHGVIAREYFDGIWSLRTALAAEPTHRSADALFDAVVARETERLAVFYAAQTRSVVFADTAPGDASDIEIQTLHALVMAHQDLNLGGLRDTLYDPTGSADRARARQCVVEGYAEFVTAMLLQTRNGVLKLAPDQFATNHNSLGAELVQMCPEGARLMAERFAAGGWTAVNALFGAMPISSEMVAHPTKRDADFPTNVGLPQWPRTLPSARLVHEDTLGEINIQRLLIERGWPATKAQRFATGWDGDRLRVYELEGGTRVILWRTLWDRVEDAVQFRNALNPKNSRTKEFRVAHRGRLVQAIACEDEELAFDLRDLLGGEIPPAEEPADAASTAQAEQELE